MGENNAKEKNSLIDVAIDEALLAVNRKRRELGEGSYCHSYMRNFFTGVLLGYVESSLRTVINLLMETKFDDDFIMKITGMNSEELERIKYFFDFPDLDDLEKQDDH